MLTFSFHKFTKKIYNPHVCHKYQLVLKLYITFITGKHDIWNKSKTTNVVWQTLSAARRPVKTAWHNDVYTPSIVNGSSKVVSMKSLSLLVGIALIRLGRLE